MMIFCFMVLFNCMVFFLSYVLNLPGVWQHPAAIPVPEPGWCIIRFFGNALVVKRRVPSRDWLAL